MRRILFLITLFVLSCSPRFHGMQALLDAPDNLIIPFDSTFLEFNPVMTYFDDMDQNLNDSIQRVVFTGSSSIRMWDSLQVDMEEFPQQFLNRGFGGSILPEVNYFFDKVISPHHPEAVVLYCGENDITEGYSAEEVLASFRTFLRLLLEKSPDSKVLYLSMKPSPSRWELWPEFKRGNRLIERFISRLNTTNIRYLDIGKPMLSQKNAYPRAELYLSDSLHMSPLGYETWKNALVPELNILLNCN